MEIFWVQLISIRSVLVLDIAYIRAQWKQGLLLWNRVEHVVIAVAVGHSMIYSSQGKKVVVVVAQVDLVLWNQLLEGEIRRMVRCVQNKLRCLPLDAVDTTFVREDRINSIKGI